METVLYSSLGSRLVIGFKNSTDFICRPWGGRVERALAEYRDKFRDVLKVRPFYNINLILAETCVTFGGETLFERDGSGTFRPTMSIRDRADLFDRAYFTDVQMAVLHVRNMAYGGNVKFQAPLPWAKDSQSITFDMGTIEVSVPENFNECLRLHTFESPMCMRGEMVQGVTIGPQKWGITSATTAETLSQQSYRMIVGSIVEVPGSKIRNVQPEDLDDLTKMEIDRLVAAIDENHVGADLSVHVSDDADRKALVSVPWLSDDFFANSSRPDGKTSALSGRMNSRSSTSADSAKM